MSTAAPETREQILQTLQQVMQELFELAPERVQPAAQLYADLDIDSIDAADLVVKLRELTGKKVKPEDFKQVRTIGDVIDVVEKMLAT